MKKYGYAVAAALLLLCGVAQGANVGSDGADWSFLFGSGVYQGQTLFPEAASAPTISYAQWHYARRNAYLGYHTFCSMGGLFQNGSKDRLGGTQVYAVGSALADGRRLWRYTDGSEEGDTRYWIVCFTI